MTRKLFVATTLALVLITCIVAQTQNNSVDPMAEALLFGTKALSTIEDFMKTALPREALAEGQLILDIAKLGIKQCEALMQTVQDIWKYKECSGEQLGKSMEALGLLKGRYYESYHSGAAALRPFYLL